jgi:hypothetical protein
MKPAQVPNANLDQEKISMRFMGLLDGVPVSRELLAIAAMRQIYLRRRWIVEDIALKSEPRYVSEAHDLVRGLLIIERLLSDAGLRTDRTDMPEPGETWLEVVEAILGGEREKLSATHAEVLQLFKKSPVAVAA